MTLSELQAEVGAWHRGIYPEAEYRHGKICGMIVAKLIEEARELEAVDELGIDAKGYSSVELEAADVLICLLAYCDRQGIDLLSEAEKKFAKVKLKTPEIQRERDRQRGIQ